MSLILIALIISLIFYRTYLYVFGKPSNSPPSIWRLPVWGSYWILLWGDYKFPHNTIQYYMKKYKSKIIGCWLGSAYTVILNDYDSVKEVLSRKEFDGRLHEAYPVKARAFGKKLG
ncbi:hypothetical protein PV327_009881 [Microctonus hyperodae]|uniref:Cytochrome P450 n=1 Tax=Microctonus hyperodae TaxID=165561 RepID=A0AA39KG14_MICHY|nr:hypothetical protein PV327_009881 [Microctonus hyperodae]